MKTRRLLCLALALIMVCSTGALVFAEEAGVRSGTVSFVVITDGNSNHMVNTGGSSIYLEEGEHLYLRFDGDVAFNHVESIKIELDYENTGFYLMSDTLANGELGDPITVVETGNYGFHIPISSIPEAQRKAWWQSVPLGGAGYIGTFSYLVVP